MKKTLPGQGYVLTDARQPANFRSLADRFSHEPAAYGGAGSHSGPERGPSSEPYGKVGRRPIPAKAGGPSDARDH